MPNDNYPGSSNSSYELTPSNTYLSLISPPQLARTARTGPQTLLGPETAISADARVVRSVLGARCTLAPGASVMDSVLWENVRVGARARVDGAVLGRDVVVGADTRVERGCLVADGVVLGPGAHLRRFMRVSVRPAGKPSEGDEELQRVMAGAFPGKHAISRQCIDYKLHSTAQTDAMRACLGQGSNSMIWPEDVGEDEADDEDDEDSTTTRANARLLRLGDTCSDLSLSDSGSITGSEASDSDSELEGGVGTGTGTLTTPGTSLSFSVSSTGVLSQSLASSTSSSTGGAVDGVVETAVAREFAAEAAASLARAFAEGHKVDDAAVELKTLRMAANVPLRLVREEVVRALVGLVPVVPGGDAAQQRREIGRVVQRWGPLVDAIGGKDAVETVAVLQVRPLALSSGCSLYPRYSYNIYSFKLETRSRNSAQRHHT